MENKLKQLFEYQKFEKNANLEALIEETEHRYGKELSDDDLSMVNAAGIFDVKAAASLRPQKPKY